MSSFRRGIRFFRSQDVKVESRPSFLKGKSYPRKNQKKIVDFLTADGQQSQVIFVCFGVIFFAGCWHNLYIRRLPGPSPRLLPGFYLYFLGDFQDSEGRTYQKPIRKHKEINKHFLSNFLHIHFLFFPTCQISSINRIQWPDGVMNVSDIHSASGPMLLISSARALERPKRSLAQGFSLNGPCQRGGTQVADFLS